MSENTTVTYNVEFSGDQYEREAFLMAINDYGGTIVDSEETGA